MQNHFFCIYLVPPSKISLFITVYIKIFSNLIKAAYNKNVFIKKTAKFRWYRRNFWKTETVTVTGYLKIKTRKPLFQKPTPVLKTLVPQQLEDLSSWELHNRVLNKTHVLEYEVKIKNLPKQHEFTGSPHFTRFHFTVTTRCSLYTRFINLFKKFILHG